MSPTPPPAPDPAAPIATELRTMNLTFQQLLAALVDHQRGQPKATEIEAIAALLVVGPNMTEISKKTGLNRTGLYRMTKFMTLYKKAQGGVRTPRKGYRTTDGVESPQDDQL